MRELKPTRPNRSRLLLGAIALSLGLSAQAQAPARNFSIAAGELGPVLEAYTAAAGVQLVYRTEDVKGLRSPGARGSMTPEAALRQLLEGTKLSVRRDESGALVVFLVAASAEAASNTSAALGEPDQKVVIQGKAISHLGERNRTGTRTDTDPMDLPQSVTTVKRELIEEQQARDLRQILANVAGFVSTPGFSATGFRARGFDASLLRNGSLTDSSSSRPTLPTYALESVEVVRGPESIIGGQAAGYGGVANLLTKAANGQRVRETQLRLGSGGLRAVGVDVGEKFGALSMRLVAEVERNGRTSVGFDGATSDYLGPSLAWENTASGTALTADMTLHKARTPSPSWAFSPEVVTNDLVPVRFPAASDSGEDSEERALSITFRQKLSSRWSLRAKVEGVQLEQTAMRPFPTQGATLYPVIPLLIAENDFRTDTDSQRLEFLGSLKTGAVDHTLLFGADSTRNRFTTDVFRSVSSLDFNTSTGAVTDTSADFGLPEPRVDTGGTARRERGFIAQDQWYWGEQWAGLIAARYVDVDNGENSYRDWLPSFGVVYRATPKLSAYANVGKAIKSNAGLQSVEGDRLPDESAVSRELGLKSLLADGTIALTGALYDIRKTNAAVPNFDVDPNFYLIEPSVRSRGIEIEASGSVGSRWQWRGTIASNRTVNQLGVRQREFPELQSSLYLRYALGRGWWSNLLFTRQDSAEPLREPRHQLDLGLGYKADKWSLTATLKSAAAKRLLGSEGVNSAVVNQERELNIAASLKF